MGIYLKSHTLLKMAAPRRNVLTGASDWQREEKQNQQRDYAAQLQEQVRRLSQRMLSPMHC